MIFGSNFCSGRRIRTKDPLESARAFFEANRVHYGHMRVRCVSAPDYSGVWRSALLIATFFSDDDAPPRQTSVCYPTALLLEEWGSPASLEELLRSMNDGKVLVDGHEVHLDERSTKFRDLTAYPSFRNAYSSCAGLLLQSDQAQGRPESLLEPLMCHAHPFYPTLANAISAWSGIGHFCGDRDTRVGTTLLYFPEQRARFSELKWRENLDGELGPVTVHLRLGGDVRNLRAKGSWRDQTGKVESFDFVVPEEEPYELSVGVPTGSADFSIYLIGPDETVFDYYREDRFFTTRDGAFRSHGARPDETRVLEATRQGEGPTIEFKPFMHPDKGSDKIAEVIRTTIAFANTKGGMILIGVNNNCGVDGIERELQKRARSQGGRSMDEEKATYEGELRALISDALNRNPGIAYDYVTVHGHALLVITVSAGPEPPYSNADNNGIFVRHGSNNVSPREDELRRLLGPQARNMFDGNETF